jgi:Tfp pilus assembly protein PilN
MITLNLIPRQQKEILKNNKLYQLIREAVMLLFLFASVVSIMMLLSRFFLEHQLADLAQRNAASIRSNEATNQRISNINSKISIVDSIQKNFQPTAPLLAAIANATPENIKLEQIRFFRQQLTLEISGSAKTRNDLLELKKSLSEAAWIKSFDLPLSSLVDKENNKFNIKIIIDPEKI